MSPDLPTPGRRSAGTSRRWSLPAVLAVVLPVLTALVLLPVRAHQEPEPEPSVPESVALGRADVACPAGLPGAPDVLVGSLVEAEGTVSLTTTGKKSTSVPLPLAPGRPARSRAKAPVVVTGTRSLAPGLLASRVGADPVTAVGCPGPRAEEWFTGLGAQATHASTIELVNPDAGVAVADISLWSTQGPVEATGTRGIAVPGRGAVSIDLSATAPGRRLLAARVVVSRGRVAASVADTTDPVGRGPVVREWLPAHGTPAETVLLPGLLPGADGQRLLVANPGEDEARVRVQLVGRSTFTPTAAQEITVPPGSLADVQLDWLRTELRRSPDAVALRLSSTQPVVGSLHSVVDDDLAVTAAGPELTATGAVVLPGRGTASLVLAGAEAAGAATVTATDARGRALLTEQLRLTPGTGTRLALPRRAALVRVDVRRTTVSGAVELGGDGGAVLPLVEPPAEGLVPSVRPATD